MYIVSVVYAVRKCTLYTAVDEQGAAAMFKYFDLQFFGGTILMLAAVAIAYLALTNASLPVLGGPKGALIGVVVVGMAACAVGGISQATTVGWTNPAIIVGSVVGTAMLLVVAAAFLGWDAQLRPIAQFVPGTLAVDLTTERIAVFALAVLMVAKWAVSVLLAVSRGIAAS